MSSKIVCLASIKPLGCTFLDWSMHWLSGQTDFFSANINSFVSLVSNPLNFSGVKNAHLHPKNHPSGFYETKKQLELLQQNSNGRSLMTIFPAPEPFDICCKLLGIGVNDLKDPKVASQVLEYHVRHFTELLSWIAIDQKIPVIFVGMHPGAIGYTWSTRSLDRKMFSPERATTQEDLELEFEQIFFPEDVKVWNKLNLNNRWDVRERLALSMRPFDYTLHNRVTFSFPHTWVNCHDLWYDTEETIKSLFNDLNLTIDPARLQLWREPANTWRSMQHEQEKFYRELDQIVYATINGHYHPIPNLTLKQEAIIQHCLIYKHGLNLKTWQLDKFPSNTQDLHKLLEPNIHLVAKIY